MERRKSLRVKPPIKAGQAQTWRDLTILNLKVSITVWSRGGGHLRGLKRLCQRGLDVQSAETSRTEQVS